MGRIRKMKLSIFFGILGLTSGQNSIEQRVKHVEDKCTFFMNKAFYCNPPRAKKSKYVHRIQKLLRDTVHHESVGKCAAPNAETGAATNSGYRKKRSIFDELEEEFNQEIEADAQPDVQSEDDGFSEKGNYSPGGAKPSTATPNPKQIDKYEMFCKK